MKDLKDIQVKDLIDTYLRTEGCSKKLKKESDVATTTSDIALPPDKASTKTKAGQTKTKKKKKKLLIGKDGQPVKGKSG